MDHLVIGRDQVGQGGSSLDDPMLAGPDPWAASHVLHAGHGTQDDLLRDLPQYPGHTDRSVVPWLLLPTLLAPGCHIGSLQSAGISPVSQDC